MEDLHSILLSVQEAIATRQAVAEALDAEIEQKRADAASIWAEVNTLRDTESKLRDAIAITETPEA